MDKDDIINGESTGNAEFEQWANKLETMSDSEVSYEIYQRILSHGNLDDNSKELFKMSYEYCMKLIRQGKNLEPNLLKIYLRDIKGQDINQIDVVSMFTLLTLCGINFSKID